MVQNSDIYSIFVTFNDDLQLFYIEVVVFLYLLRGNLDTAADDIMLLPRIQL